MSWLFSPPLKISTPADCLVMKMMHLTSLEDFYYLKQVVSEFREPGIRKFTLEYSYLYIRKAVTLG